MNQHAAALTIQEQMITLINLIVTFTENAMVLVHISQRNQNQ